jgi:NDP-sugar pyrophosphorylase family protein
MQAVILAGGLGTRLKPFTEVIPKPLLPIGEKSILEIQISALKKHGFDEIFLATYFKSDYIKNFLGDGSNYGVSLTVSKEEQPLGTAGPLSLLRDRLKKPFIMMNGDILTLMDFRDFYDFGMKIDAPLTLAIKEVITPFAFGNIFHEGDYVTGIQEKPDIKMNVLAGVYFFKPEALDLIPDGKYFGMDTLITDLIKEKTPVGKYEISEYWLDIGQVDSYQEAQDIYEQHFQE